MVMKVMMLMTMMVIMVTIGDKHTQAANLVIIIAMESEDDYDYMMTSNCI